MVAAEVRDVEVVKQCVQSLVELVFSGSEELAMGFIVENLGCASATHNSREGSLLLDVLFMSF